MTSANHFAMVWPMRNITRIATATVRRAATPMPPRGEEGCICQESGPAGEFIVLGHPRNPDQRWYARKSCPFHGLTVTESPLNSET